MNDLIVIILGVIFVVVNGLTQLVFAQTQNFKLKPGAIGMFIAGVMSGLLGLVSPITGQSAMIALAGKITDQSQRVGSLLVAGLIIFILGVTDLVSTALIFVGPAIVAGMMAGVGLMLTNIATDFIFNKEKGNLQVGLVSLISALIIFFVARVHGTPNDLVYTIAGSVTLSTLYYLLVQRKHSANEVLASSESNDGKFWTKAYWQSNDWKVVKPIFNFKVLLSALALVTLAVGTTTSFNNINASLAGGIEQNVDHLTMISGIASIGSTLFGGLPLAPIISGTAAAPHPVVGNVAVMLILVVLLISGVVTRITKYIPTQSIAGFLIIIGIFSTFIPQLSNPGFQSNIGVAGISMAVTKLSNNPFLGVLAGLFLRTFGYLIGL